MATIKEMAQSRVAKWTGILTLVSLLSGMIYGYVMWHFNTFVHVSNLENYQTTMTQEIAQQYGELSTRTTLNYLEVIITIKEEQLRQLDDRVDRGDTLTTSEIRRRDALARAIERHKTDRAKLIGLPEGLTSPN